LFFRFTQAPWSKSSVTISAYPLLHATWSAVSPSWRL
jgi:hypothetical protein